MQGLGTDIIEIQRIERALQTPRFLLRVFTPYEHRYVTQSARLLPQRAAGIFCAKEAIAKALGTGFTGGLKLTDIEITHSELGAPIAHVHGRENLQILLSISHCQTYATATALVQEGIR